MKRKKKKIKNQKEHLYGIDHKYKIDLMIRDVWVLIFLMGCALGLRIRCMENAVKLQGGGSHAWIDLMVLLRACIPPFLT